MCVSASFALLIRLSKTFLRWFLHNLYHAWNFWLLEIDRCKQLPFLMWIHFLDAVVISTRKATFSDYRATLYYTEYKSEQVPKFKSGSWPTMNHRCPIRNRLHSWLRRSTLLNMSTTFWPVCSPYSSMATLSVACCGWTQRSTATSISS